MSFLFGKKKDAKDAKVDRPPPTRDGPPGSGPAGAVPSANGIRIKERGAGVQSPAPPIGASNQGNTVDGANTPSPEQGQELSRALDQEIQHVPPRSMPNGPSGPPPSVNPAALYPWSQRRLTFTSSQPNPFPRYGAAVNAVSSKEGEVYLMGGLVNGSTVKGDLWMIEAGGTNLACYPVGTTFEGPGPRVGHASLLVGNAFIVFGGDTKMDERDKLDDTLYLLNTSTRHWSRSMPPGPRPAGRYGHTLNILGSKIYVFGGQVEGYFFNDLLAFDLNTLQNSNSKWESLIQNSNEGGPSEGQIPPARTNHTVVSWNDKLYLFGGTNGTQWFNDVWSYDPKHVAWTQLDCIGYIPAPREGHSAALVNDVMYIFGGRTEEGTDLGDLAAFRITSRRWYTFQNMGPSPSPRSGHSMTSYGKQIVVLAGEPSSAPRDPGELSLVYVLDTGKIRYPNDQQIQQTPSGERVPGNRRPSQERGTANQRPNGVPENTARKYSGSRESIVGVPRGPVPAPGVMGPGGRGQDPAMGAGPTQAGPGSRLPRASVAQTVPPGPPPPQQAPPPRPNGVSPQNGSRSRTPTRDGRFGPPVETGRSASFETENNQPSGASPVTREVPRSGSAARAISPAVNGRRTPQGQQQQQIQPQQATRFGVPTTSEEDTSKYDGNPGRSRSRQGTQTSPPTDETNQFPASNPQQQQRSLNQYEGSNDMTMRSNGAQKAEPSVPLPQFQQLQSQHQGLLSQHEGLQNQYQGLQGQHDGLQSQFEQLRSQQHGLHGQHQDTSQELHAAKSRNAWYASELALAKKAGYQPNPSNSPTLDERAAQSFGDDDQPLLEALIAVRAQLAEVQGQVNDRENAAAQEVAEVEHQRDNAIREAAYAKAKLAAHGGSHAGTPQSEAMPRELGHEDRTNDLGRQLAVALAAQAEMRTTIVSLSSDVQNERRARELAEGHSDAAQKRAAEFDQSRNPGELETLRSELHQTGNTARDEASRRMEAQSRAEILHVEKEDLSRQLEEALENTKQHSTTFGSLREALTSSTDKTSILEKKLDDERRQRELVDRKLLHLRSEHEERTAELDETTRKLRDAEEMVTTHAAEAKTHRLAVVAGLDKLNSRDVSRQASTSEDERVPLLRRQLEEAQALVKKNQADADDAAQKLRRAEERIAGLEAYQEQSSRESLAVRKQLQEAVRDSQALQAKHSTVHQQLESSQRDTSALSVKHNALKELLDERGISEHSRARNMDSPASRFDTPDNSRLRDLEQQLEASERAHQDTKSTFESRESETDKTYRERLELLENDYQSAVSYVKGTEKMLKRMKDELSKYKKQNERLQTDLDTAQQSQSRSIEPDAAEWEQERTTLRREIDEMQQSLKDQASKLDYQLAQVQTNLQTAQQERDHYRQGAELSQQRHAQSTQQARTELDQLKNENTMLETRALDAEQKITLLLEQVGTSVGNYRRQSQLQTQPNGLGHTRNMSAISTTSTNAPNTALNFAGGRDGTHSHSNSADPSSSFPSVPGGGENPENNRNSLALDSLASELETLRSQWEDTHRTYRLSNQFDFENTPTSASGHGGMRDDLANWRKRLDAEEASKKHTGGGDLHAARGGGSASSEEDEERERERNVNRESGVIRPHEKMPGGLAGISDTDESDEEEEESVEGRRRGGRNYVL